MKTDLRQLTADTEQARPDSACDNSWSVGETFAMRVAGLPVETAQALRAPRLREWADQAGALDERLATGGGVLSDLLRDVVGGVTDDDTRRGLVRLRRDVFNNRLPRDLAEARRIAAAISEPLGDQLTSWLADRERLAETRLAGPAIMAAEMDQARAALRLLAAEPRFRQGLLLASPTLDRYLDSYANGTGELTKRQRRMERSLLEYVYRTACKTSPFSTFAGVTVGEFTGAPAIGRAGGLPSVVIGDRWTSHARLNVAVLGRIADLVLASDTFRMDLPLTIVSGWSQDPERIRFVRRTVAQGTEQAAVSFDFVRESLLYLRHYQGIADVFGLLERQPRLRYGELLARFADVSGTGPATADRFLQALVRLGLIQVPDLAVDIHSPDPARGFRAAVASLGTPWAAQLAARLDELIAVQDSYAAAGLAERRSLLAALRQLLADLPGALGAEPASFPQTILYEDVRIDGALPGLDRGALTDSIGDSLRALAAISPAFDKFLPHRLTLKGYFLARYGRGGRCDDLLGLVHDFHEELFDQYLSSISERRAFSDDGQYVPQDNWLEMPEVTAIDRARAEFARRMRVLSAGGGDRDLVLDDEFIDAVAGELREAGGGFRPQSHFLQLAQDSGRTIAVLNDWWCGLAWPFTRFLHCFADIGPQGLAGRIRASLRAAQPPGTVFAELTGGFNTTNLNLHDRLTDFELVCPGETSSVPPSARIPLEDLYVEHDEPGDRLVLRSVRLGREVIPVYLGYLVPHALPEIPRTLMLFSPFPLVDLDIWAGVQAGQRVPAPDAGPATVQRRPRVWCGDVVLSRCSWSTTVAGLPARTPGADDSEWFLGWRDWRRRHGLPEQVFVSLHPISPEQAKPEHAKAKPHYVDFASILSLTVLDGMLGGHTGPVVFHEALPAEEQAFVRSARGHHVAELVVETTARSRPGPPAGSGGQENNQKGRAPR
jgi:hypothetical protein